MYHRPLLVFEDFLDVICSFNATSRMPSPKHAEILTDDKTLTVQGIIVDRVLEVGTTLLMAAKIASGTSPLDRAKAMYLS